MLNIVVVKCKYCEGKGWLEKGEICEVCESCNGKGWIPVLTTSEGLPLPCEFCGGTGKKEGKPCQACNGTGWAGNFYQFVERIFWSWLGVMEEWRGL